MTELLILGVMCSFVLLFLLMTLGGIIAEHGERHGLVDRRQVGGCFLDEKGKVQCTKQSRKR